MGAGKPVRRVWYFEKTGKKPCGAFSAGEKTPQGCGGVLHMNGDAGPETGAHRQPPYSVRTRRRKASSERSTRAVSVQ